MLPRNTSSLNPKPTAPAMASACLFAVMQCVLIKVLPSEGVSPDVFLRTYCMRTTTVVQKSIVSKTIVQ